MIKQVVIPPYDQYQLSTFVIKDDLVEIGHFGGFMDENNNDLDNFESQMNQTLINLNKALKEIDLSLDNVLKLTVILKDIKDFKVMHKVWKKHFKKGKYPVRSVITSDFVSDKCLVQVEGTAAYK